MSIFAAAKTQKDLNPCFSGNKENFVRNLIMADRYRFRKEWKSKSFFRVWKSLLPIKFFTIKYINKDKLNCKTVYNVY